MVNPQREHGHTDLANSIVEQFCRYRISGGEWQVLWVILRKTYGWNKKHDRIPLSQFSDMTGLTRSACVRVLSKLITRGVIQKENTIPTTYSFVKVYTHWRVLPKQIPRGCAVTLKENKSVICLGNQVLPKKRHSNTTISNTTTNTSRPKAHLSDFEWIQSLKTSIAYKHINIDIELAKMDAWLSTRKGRQKTHRFIVNWLNKIDKPINLKPEIRPQTRQAHEKEKPHDPNVLALINKTTQEMKRT